MGSFLERPLVQKDFDPNYQVLVKMCDKELDNAKVIFDDQLARADTPEGVFMSTEFSCGCACAYVYLTVVCIYMEHFIFSGPMLHKNMPRVAGMLKWCQELRDRVNSSLDKLRSLDKGGYVPVIITIIYVYVALIIALFMLFQNHRVSRCLACVQQTR